MTTQARACIMAEPSSVERSCCVRRYHVYRTIWQAAVLTCKREYNNDRDRYAVAVLKNDNITDHLPKKLSKLCSLFLKRGGEISCKVMGSKRYSRDLPLPCVLVFKSKEQDLHKLKRLFPTNWNSS